jgi:transcriptional regulator with XRE-family HTH domain
MTPFGERLRALRAERGITLKAMAAQLGLSPAYLSALEHGRRGRPTHALVVAVCAQLNIIWDDADELIRLARLSHPRITVDTAGLSRWRPSSPTSSPSASASCRRRPSAGCSISSRRSRRRSAEAAGNPG